LKKEGGVKNTIVGKVESDIPSGQIFVEERICIAKFSTSHKGYARRNHLQQGEGKHNDQGFFKKGCETGKDLLSRLYSRRPNINFLVEKRCDFRSLQENRVGTEKGQS